jgi:hypothetical protein
MTNDSFYSCKSLLDMQSDVSPFDTIQDDLFRLHLDSDHDDRDDPSDADRPSTTHDWIRPNSVRAPRQPSLYENTNETSADLLTASQIQSIVSHHRICLNPNHRYLLIAMFATGELVRFDRKATDSRIDHRLSAEGVRMRYRSVGGGAQRASVAAVH